MIGENVDCVALFVVFVADMVPDDWRECRLCCAQCLLSLSQTWSRMIGENVDCVAMFVVFVADMVPDDWRECRLCCIVCCLCRRHGAG